MNENEKAMFKAKIEEDQENLHFNLNGLEGFIEAIEVISPNAEIHSLHRAKNMLRTLDDLLERVKKDIQKPVSAEEDSKLRAALEEAKTFIVYAASELKEGKASITNGDQFPKKEDAKIMIQKLEALL